MAKKKKKAAATTADAGSAPSSPDAEEEASLALEAAEKMEAAQPGEAGLLPDELLMSEEAAEEALLALEAAEELEALEAQEAEARALQEQQATELEQAEAPSKAEVEAEETGFDNEGDDPRALLLGGDSAADADADGSSALADERDGLSVQVDAQIRRFIKGKVLLSLLVGVLTGLLLYSLSVDLWLGFGVVAFWMNVRPATPLSHASDPPLTRRCPPPHALLRGSSSRMWARWWRWRRRCPSCSSRPPLAPSPCSSPPSSRSSSTSSSATSLTSVS